MNPEQQYLDTRFPHVPMQIRYVMTVPNKTECFSKPSTRWTTYDARGKLKEHWLVRQFESVVIAHQVGKNTDLCNLYAPGCVPVVLSYHVAVKWAYDYVERGTTWN